MRKKKFNLDRPDGSQYYWHALRKKLLFSKRPFGGGSVMVCEAFSPSGKADLEVMEGKQNSARYINVLEKSIFPLMNRLDINNALFQQANAVKYTSKLTKDWFKQKILKIRIGPPRLQI